MSTDSKWYAAELLQDIRTEDLGYEESGPFLGHGYGMSGKNGVFLKKGETVFVRREDWSTYPHRVLLNGKWQDDPSGKKAPEGAPDRYGVVFEIYSSYYKLARAFGLATCQKFLRRIREATPKEVESIEKGMEYIRDKMSY